MSRSYDHLLAGVASQIWCMEEGFAHRVLAALQARLERGTPWPDDEREHRIAAARNAMPMPVPLNAGDAGGSRGSVFVAPLMGLLLNRMDGMSAMSTGGTSLSKFAAEVTAASHNPSVAAILVHTDSGGGSAIGSEAAHRALADAGTRVHTTALVEGTAASAALWVAGAAKETVAVPGSVVGSIGCFAVHESVDLTKIGVTSTVITSSPRKTQFSPFVKLSEAAKADLQSQVDAVASTSAQRL